MRPPKGHTNTLQSGQSAQLHVKFMELKQTSGFWPLYFSNFSVDEDKIKASNFLGYFTTMPNLELNTQNAVYDSELDTWEIKTTGKMFDEINVFRYSPLYGVTAIVSYPASKHKTSSTRGYFVGKIMSLYDSEAKIPLDKLTRLGNLYSPPKEKSDMFLWSCVALLCVVIPSGTFFIHKWLRCRKHKQNTIA